MTNFIFRPHLSHIYLISNLFFHPVEVNAQTFNQLSREGCRELFLKRNFQYLPQKGQEFGNYLIICQAMNCWSLLFSELKKCYRPRRLCIKNVLKKGEIVEEAVREELT